MIYLKKLLNLLPATQLFEAIKLVDGQHIVPTLEEEEAAIKNLKQNKQNSRDSFVTLIK